MRMKPAFHSLALAAALLLGAATAQAQSAGSPAAPGKVVVAGDVPDEATRQAILKHVRDLYGADLVVDQLGVRAVAVPPNWAQQVQRVLTP